MWMQTNKRTSIHLMSVSFIHSVSVFVCGLAGVNKHSLCLELQREVSPSLIHFHSTKSSRLCCFGAGWCQDGSSHPWRVAEDERWWKAGQQMAHTCSAFFFLFFPHPLCWTVFFLFYWRCLSVVKYLENLPTMGEAGEKMARCAFYLSLLLQLARQKNVSRKCAWSFFLLCHINCRQNLFKSQDYITAQLWGRMHEHLCSI